MAGPMKWNPYKFYDVTEADLAANKERAELRKIRKAEWQRKITNPFKPLSYNVRDPAVQRMYALRVWSFAQWRATAPKSIATLFLGFFFPIGGLMYWHQTYTYNREMLYRQGKVAYKDRLNKLFT